MLKVMIFCHIRTSAPASGTAAIQHDDIGGHRKGQFDPLFHEDEREPAFGACPTQAVKDPLDHDRSEVLERLIEEEDAGRAGERSPANAPEKSARTPTFTMSARPVQPKPIRARRMPTYAS